MKNNLLLSVSLVVSTILSLTSCSKVNSNTDSEQTSQDIQTAIVGSWQFTEKGIEVAMHDGHICTDPQNMAQDKVTYVVQWEKVASDERRDFKQNGAFNRFLKSVMT